MFDDDDNNEGEADQEKLANFYWSCLYRLGGASSLEIAYKEVLFNIIKPSPHHIPIKN